MQLDNRFGEVQCLLLVSGDIAAYVWSEPSGRNTAPNPKPSPPGFTMKLRARARLPDEDERLTACAVAVGEGAGGRCRLVVKAGKQLGSRSTLSFSRYDLM